MVICSRFCLTIKYSEAQSKHEIVKLPTLLSIEIMREEKIEMLV